MLSAMITSPMTTVVQMVQGAHALTGRASITGQSRQLFMARHLGRVANQPTFMRRNLLEGAPTREAARKQACTSTASTDQSSAASSEQRALSALIERIQHAHSSINGSAYDVILDCLAGVECLVDTPQQQLHFAIVFFGKTAKKAHAVVRRRQRAPHNRQARSSAPRGNAIRLNMLSAIRSTTLRHADRVTLAIPSIAEVASVRNGSERLNKERPLTITITRGKKKARSVHGGAASKKRISARRLRLAGSVKSPAKVVSKRRGSVPTARIIRQGSPAARARSVSNNAASSRRRVVSRKGAVKLARADIMPLLDVPRQLHRGEAADDAVNAGGKPAQRYAPKSSLWRHDHAKQVAARKKERGMRVARVPSEPHDIVVEKTVRGTPLRAHYVQQRNGNMVFAGWEPAAARDQRTVELSARALPGPLARSDAHYRTLGLGKPGGESQPDMPYFKAGKRDLGHVLASLVLEQLRDPSGPASIDDNQLWNTFNRYVIASGYADLEAALSKEDWMMCLRSSLLFAARATPVIDDNGERPDADVHDDMARVLGIDVDRFYEWEQHFGMETISENLFAADDAHAGTNGPAEGSGRWLKALAQQIAMRAADKLGGHDVGFGVTREQEIETQWAVRRVSVIPSTEDRIEHAFMMARAFAARNKHMASRFMANIIRHSVLNTNRADTVRRDDDTTLVQEAG